MEKVILIKSGDDDDDGYNLTLIISTIRQTRQASFHRIGQLFPNQTIMNLTNHLSWNLVILEHLLALENMPNYVVPTFSRQSKF